ncbi:MAG TPA: hypothetical protein VF765_01070 [Polyangiaceae bacterium]
MAVREVILPFPAHVHPIRAIRSTVIVGSFAVLRENQLFDAYASALPTEKRELLVHIVAGAWIPLELALVHYAACDSLELPHDTIAQFGRGVFDRIRGTLLGTTVRMAREAGVTPWTVLPHLQRFWDRAYQGGGLSVIKLGPKEARGDVIQAPICDSVYFRHALRGLLAGVLELFCNKAYVSLLQTQAPASVAYQMQWA